MKPKIKMQYHIGANGEPDHIFLQHTLNDGTPFAADVPFDASMSDVAQARYADLQTPQDVGDLLREFGTEIESATWIAGRSLDGSTGKLEKKKPVKRKANTSTLLPFDAYDLIIVSFSGGKDSLACVLHLIELGVPRDRIELWHQAVDGEPGRAERFFDWPVTESYCKSVSEALGIKLLFQWREGGFEREMLRNRSLTAPSDFERIEGGVGHAGGERGKLTTRMKFPQLAADLKVRWCSAYLKIDVAKRALANDKRFNGKKILMLTGERRQESSNRALYAQIEEHSTTNETKRVDQWRAILNWRENEVWAIIERHNILPHPAYYAGFSRVSCMSCIFGNPDQWATVRELSPSTFAKIARYEQDFGAFWDLPASRQLEREMRAEANAKLAAKGKPIPAPKPDRPYGQPLTIHRTKTVGELANEGVSYLDDPKLIPTDRLLARRSASLAMREHFGSARSHGPWLLPLGAYKHSGGPI
jgi:3'-phosphoadenosine 5'-phosphosulfate sulfotransferase (PAPS reductase)/FAD synthetase